MKNLNKKYLLIILIILSVIVLIGTSYGLLRSSQIGENSYVMNVGLLEVSFLDSETNALNVSNMVPSTDEKGKSTNEELSFTIKNTGTIDAKYNIYIEETSTNPEFKTVIRHISNKNDEGYNSPKTLSENNFIDTLGELKVGETSIYEVKVWLSEEADATYMNQEFKARVVVEVIQGDAPASYFLQKSINESTCNPTVVEDGITYLSGTNECINFNYVWYSGKLWRITAIYPDGSMKMITEDLITSIAYGEDVNFYTDGGTNSWMYQWLNQDFLNTLYNYESIVEVDSTWNVASGDEKISTKLAEATITTATVGLLNSYEYYMSYKNTNSSSGYLNIGYNWWLLNPYSLDFSEIWRVNYEGTPISVSPLSGTSGVRPSIKLKSTLDFVAGTGNRNNPYIIKGDIGEITNNKTLLSTRISGEYVKLENDSDETRIFRIIGSEIIEDKTTTKLITLDYVKHDEEILTKLFSSNYIYGEGTNDNYWDYYLNNNWLLTLDSNKLVKGIYYLGMVKYGTSYKSSICETVSNIITSSECIKINDTWTGYVGLPRYGEMFSSMLGNGRLTSSNIWLITPSSTMRVWAINRSANLETYELSSILYSVRPTINLTSSVVIKSGTGLPNDPFIVGLPS